ncbi:TIR domain-containing protein [Solimonas aquatica]|uniref:TIR domain-containing protein n=1 Tax=Solimonas aquatica TaxID=489703 RepID=A0A1H8ZYJ1_9GAMM|nr:toll/interleukin-1 receptor domain-containing protein [Solimonas aquatica]SEP69499.1 TIR domain-containing protein [Solimonas aquatica]
MPKRETIFISHATPDDNAIAGWLAARLSSMGYRVWVDLKQLKGGDPFWGDIQAAIRNESNRVLCIVTRNSVDRQGVLNEIAEASSVAKAIRDSRFIIPIRGDEISWDEFPIQLKRLNGIDFSTSWHQGLMQVIDAFDRDSIACFAGNPDVLKVARHLATSTLRVNDEPEVAYLNRVQILRLPSELHYYRTALTAPELLNHHDKLPWPHAPYMRLVLGFIEPGAVGSMTPEGFELVPAYRATTTEFAGGTAVGVPDIDGGDARRMLASILRQGFENTLARAGLVRFGEHRWFVPANWRPANVGHYRKLNGKRGDRVLVGRAKELTWHFGLSFRVAAGLRPRIDLRAEVVFSADGVKPFEDQKQYRRKHCKAWWNDRWRDLLSALLAELFGFDAETAEVPLGGGASMTIDPRLVQLTLQRSYDTEAAFVPNTEEEAEELVEGGSEQVEEEHE